MTRTTKSVLVAVAVGAVLLLCVVVLVVRPTPKPADKPAAPAASTTPSQATTDQLAMEPGAFCATSQLGKTFQRDGVTYTCQTPKPYRWRS